MLSSTYLALDEDARRALAAERDLATRYARTVQAVQSAASEERRAAAVDAFWRTSGCHAYTSGCTMRLMGIGSIAEQQADLFLCDPLRFKNVSGWHVALKATRGDVVVTNPLPSSAHILTCDYLMHMSPCVILMAARRMEVGMNVVRYAQLEPSFARMSLETAGGAPVIHVRIGEETFRCTLDRRTRPSMLRCAGGQTFARAHGRAADG